MAERSTGSVTYRDVDHSYFEKRGLRRHAGVWSLWALGVGAVISGDFFGRNFGLAAGGFGGLLIATAIIALATLVFLFLNPDYRIGVWGAAVWFLAGIVYFALIGRHKPVLSPEEEFAMTRGEHGARPEAEGYGQTGVSQTR